MFKAVWGSPEVPDQLEIKAHLVHQDFQGLLDRMDLLDLLATEVLVALPVQMETEVHQDNQVRMEVQDSKELLVTPVLKELLGQLDHQDLMGRLV